MGRKDIDSELNQIHKLIEIMKENDLVEIEITNGSDRIFLKRATAASLTPVPVAGAHVPVILNQPAGSAPSGSAAQSLPVGSENLQIIKSPVVGTFYATPTPDSPPYVEVGSKVEPQTVVCIIEAMKVMNEIKAETSGTVLGILVKNGQAVEYGQPLFKIKPD